MEAHEVHIGCPYGCREMFHTEFELSKHGALNHPGQPILHDHYQAKYGRLNETYDKETRNDHEKWQSTAKESTLNAKAGNKIQFCSNIVLREAREEDLLVKQLLYGMLSAYAPNPLNLAVNSPTGSGKTHAITKTTALFPKNDLVLLAGMTEKALFHRPGILVIRNEHGEYENIEPKIAELHDGIDTIRVELEGATDKNQKAELRKKRATLEQKMSEILRDAKKLIDLSHKVLVFLDTPPTALFAAIMPLLSHDAWEVEYDFVDTHNGIKTKSNVLRGWPAVVFAQAKDSSQHPRWPEIARRFIMINPKQSDTKIKAAIDLTAKKHGLPDSYYQKVVVSDSEKELARSMIEGIKTRLLKMTNNYKPGGNGVFIPYAATIAESLPASETLDMTVANRFFAWLSLLPLVNSDERPLLVNDESVSPIATFEDLKEATALIEYANGQRPYVQEWYNDVFVPACKEKGGPISIREIARWMEEKTGKRASREYLRAGYLEPLYNQGYVDKEQNPEDKRESLFSPVKEKQCKLFSSNKVLVKNSALYPDPSNLEGWIRSIVTDAEILDASLGESATVTLTIAELVSKYFANPSLFFDIDESSVPPESGLQ